MQWETVIGLEIHAQLATKSKIFSGASTAYGAEPNTQACAVDLGLPGVLPVLNQNAVRMAVKFGLAIDAELTRRSVFARKNYFYPDLNRAGTPLLEIVSEPDMRSAKEAVAYMKKIHALVTYIGICDGNMQEGSFRCDANVSVRPKGQEEFGTRTELKNINSFRFVERAINIEVERQIDVIEGGGEVVQETRLYDPDRNETRSMRSKEEANDYRYFPDPDLLPVELDDALIEAMRAELPELPDARRQRFMDEHGLSSYDASVLTASRDMADYFESVAKACGNAKLAANWVMGDLSGALNKEGLDITASPVNAERLGGMLARIEDNTISGKIAKTVFEAMWGSDDDADAIIDQQGLKQITDTGAIEAMVDEVIAANPKQVEEFLGGKDKMLGFFVGQVMKASKGKANPQQINQLLRDKLKR